MNSSILAARTAQAIEAIQRHTERLGGRLVLPTRAFPDQATKHALILEAIVEGLAGIEPPGNVAVEPVEAIITVVKEPEGEDAPKGKAGAKGKQGKE